MKKEIKNINKVLSFCQNNIIIMCLNGLNIVVIYNCFPNNNHEFRKIYLFYYEKNIKSPKKNNKLNMYKIILHKLYTFCFKNIS